MKKKSVASKVPVDAPVYPVGTRVVIKRPHLWAGCVGEVIAVTEGLHRVRINQKPDGVTLQGYFHTDCNGNEMEVDL